MLTEAQWNTTSTLKHQPYSYSKTAAERAAWEIADAQDQWRLVTVNPSLVLGPGVAAAHTSESFSILRQFGDGTMKAGALPFEIGMVDVRDVAEAHMRAGFLPEAEGRHITSARTISFIELAKALAEKVDGDWPFPKAVLPKLMVWLVGPLFSNAMSRRIVANNFGLPWQADHSKSVNELGLTYRDPADAAAEMFTQMVNAGQFGKR